MKKFILTCIVAILNICSIMPALALENLNFKAGYISDNADLLMENDYSAVTSIIKELQEKTSAEIAVVTLNSLDNQKVEDVAVEIGRKFKVGAKDKNNGVVVLVAPNEKTARIEVGIGLENVISNQKAQTIMDDDMVPYFAKGYYSSGIYRGVASIANVIATSQNVELSSTSGMPAQEKNDKKIPFWAWPIILIASLLGVGKKGNFGGGGGFSGGKGATGRW